MKKLIVSVIILLILAIGLATYYCVYQKKIALFEDELTFADASTVWWTAPTIIAKTENLYKKRGLAVKAFDVTTGLESKNAVLNGKADVGLVASTPLAIGAVRNEQILVLGIYVASKNLITLLSEVNIDGSPCVKNNKKCAALIDQLTTVYVPGTISEFYFLEYLKKHNLMSFWDKIKLHSLKVNPPAIPDAFGSTVNKRKINTAVIWEPFASVIRKSYAATGQELPQQQSDADLYELTLYLITTPEVWGKKKSAILKFVGAVAEADKLLSDQSDIFRTKIEQHYKYSPGWLQDKWGDVAFKYDTSKDRIKALLEKDASLAIETGLITVKPQVDYLLQVLDEVGTSISKEETLPGEVNNEPTK